MAHTKAVYPLLNSAVLLIYLPLEMLKSDCSVKQVQILYTQSKAELKEKKIPLERHRPGFVRLSRSRS